MALRYPTRDTRAAAYRRLLLGFFQQGLMPFVDWAEHKGDSLKQNYSGREPDTPREWDWKEYVRREFHAVIDLYDLLGTPATPPSQDEIEEKLHFVRTRNPPLSQSRDSMPYYASCQLEPLHTILFTEPERWWNATETDLAERFARLHQWCTQRKRELRYSHSLMGVPSLRRTPPKPFYIVAMAEAYLAALEAECPVRDWLGPGKTIAS